MLAYSLSPTNVISSRWSLICVMSFSRSSLRLELNLTVLEKPERVVLLLTVSIVLTLAILSLF